MLVKQFGIEAGLISASTLQDSTLSASQLKLAADLALAATKSSASIATAALTTSNTLSSGQIASDKVLTATQTDQALILATSQKSQADILATSQLFATSSQTAATLSVIDAIKALTAAMGGKLSMEKAVATSDAANKAEATAKGIYDNLNSIASSSITKVNTAYDKAVSDKNIARDAQIKASSLTTWGAAPTTHLVGQTSNAAWEGLLANFQTLHQARFGSIMNRDWNSDAGAQATYQSLVKDYNVVSQQMATAAQVTANSLLAIANGSVSALQGLQNSSAVDSSKASAALSQYQTASAYALAAKNVVINGFASGGEHAGGWRIVGESGPELEQTGPSRIYSNNQSKSLVDNSELIAEIKELRKVVEKQQQSLDKIAASSKETANILDNNTAGGGAMLVQVIA